jgi:hypothetical protein
VADAMVDGRLRSGVNGGALLATFGRSELSIKLVHVWRRTGGQARSHQWGCLNETAQHRIPWRFPVTCSSATRHDQRSARDRMSLRSSGLPQVHDPS